MPTPEKPHLLIYDDGRFYNGEESIHFENARQGAELAGWLPLGYDVLDIAVEDLDQTISGLVAVVSRPGMREGHSQPLFDRAAELNVPKAVIASTFGTSDIIRPGSVDILIKGAPQQYVPKRLKTWLNIVGASLPSN